LITLSEAADMGCRACASPGGGCQFLGTAATSQVVGEALGLSLPHSALAPSGQEVWLDMARRSASALIGLSKRGVQTKDILTDASVRNAMVVHAAFGGSTNLLLHIPAIAHAAGLRRPIVADWIEVNRKVPRLVSVLPNGPVHHPTVRVFLAGGVPEVMLHLRELGLLNLDVLTVTGTTLGENLSEWERSERRKRFKELLLNIDGVSADEVILNPHVAREKGLKGTLAFLRGNIAPEGSVVKATAINPKLLNANGVFEHEGSTRVFTSEHNAIKALKEGAVSTGEVIVLAGAGPMGTGMEETYQLTGALKHYPRGETIPLITDARFSGVSTGACVGHVGPEALAGGPIGKLKDGDVIRVRIDTSQCEGTVDLVGSNSEKFSASEGERVLSQRTMRGDIAAHPGLPEDTRLWAALQAASGGTWGGCVYDPKAIALRLKG
jgi:putative YjhG/YagF family dehydratase